MLYTPNNYIIVGIPIDIETDIDNLSDVEKFRKAKVYWNNTKAFLKNLNSDNVDTENMLYYAIKLEKIVDKLNSNELSHRDKIIIKLESLVGRRFTKKSLEQGLSKIFNEKITLVLSGQDYKTAPDWNYIFCSNNKNYGGDFDVYVLKQKHKDNIVGNTLYVTEVGYDFH